MKKLIKKLSLVTLLIVLGLQINIEANASTIFKTSNANVYERGDINKDDVVDGSDLSLVASKYNLKNDNSEYNESYDINGDKIIDIYDLVLISTSFPSADDGQASIELKDVKSVDLYTKVGDSTVLVKEINTVDFNPSNYIAKINTKSMPAVYTQVNYGYMSSGEFLLKLGLDNLVSYKDTKKINGITVSLGEVVNNKINRIYEEEFMNIIKSNSQAEVHLTQDLDFTNINSTDLSIITSDFKGKIYGNGFTINNLGKPLFNNLNGAEIYDLLINNASVTNVRGILSNSITNSKIKNVYIKDSTITATHTNGTGAITGNLNNSSLEECSVINSNINGSKRTGAMAGTATSGSLVKNSFAQGVVKTNSDAAGGVIGELSGTIFFENCYSKVELITNGSYSRAGMIGYIGGNQFSISNSISLSDGQQGARIISIGSYKAINTYEIAESKLSSNKNISGINEISQNDVNSEFFLNILKWNSDIWDMTNVNKDKLPMLKKYTLMESNHNSLVDKNKNIPEVERLKKLSVYNVNKEKAYANMFKLMPFYDANLYVTYGNRVSEDNILNTKNIKTIIPYNNEGKMIVSANTENYNSISKIKIIFEDEQTIDLEVSFKKMLGDVTTYTIPSLDLEYNYDRFVLKSNISLVNEIIESAKLLDYATDIAGLTSEEESRLYVDYYNESVKSRLGDIVKNLLNNEDDYNLYLDNDILKTKIKNDLINNGELKKALYSYNYFNKWYNFEIGKIPLSDIIFFNVENMVDDNSSIKGLVKDTLSQSESVRATTSSIAFYNNVIKPKGNNLEIKSFLEYYIKVLAGNTNPDNWFKDNFKGQLREVPIEGKENEVIYRAWTAMNRRNHLLLPILSAPQQDMYIISVPSQICIGSLNRYSQHKNGQTEDVKNMIDSYASKIANFYGVSSQFIDNSTDILNKRTHVQYDSRFNFPGSGNQDKGTTQDSVVKWVYEAINVFQAANGSGAYANGTDVFWVAYAALTPGTFSFKVFTHETAHNQDGSYFYEGRGRRSGTGAEDHSDANIAQDLGDGSLVFNLREDFNFENDVSNNFTLNRINNKDKIYSYYKEMFETYYVLDYLTAQAFLKLTPDEQSKLATQAEDTNGNTVYKKLTAADFQSMNLRTMEDLWNNKIVFRNSGTVGSNSYGGDSHYNIYWYQPHIDNGRPDSYSFKKLGFEMLGVGGYTNGYAAYRSGRSANDLDALRIATNNPENTWKDYKLNRFNNVQNNLDNIPYFDANRVVDLYKEALLKDAAAGNRSNTDNLRRVLYGTVKRGTNDFDGTTIYSESSKKISSASQLISEISKSPIGTFKLTGNLDFSGIDVASKEAYILDTFLGVIDGDGFKITGLKKPLIKKSVYGQVKNLTIEGSVYGANELSSIIIDGKNSIIEDVRVIDANIILPFIKNKTGACYEVGNNTNTVRSNTISSIEDLNRINDDTTGLARKMKYTVTANIDVSSITSRASIITGQFTGEIDGNGFTIRNGRVPLLQELRGNIKNLNFENCNMGGSGVNAIGTLASSSNGANVESVKLNNITIVGRDNAAGLIGTTTNTNINKITAININITGTNFYAGGLVGRSFNTNVSNVVVSGDLTITKTHNGGIIAAMQGGSLVNAFGNMRINRPSNGDSRNQNGGLVGTFENRNGTISNSIAVNNVNNDVYKVIAAKDISNLEDIKNNIKNVYEISSTTGLSSANTEGNIKAIENTQLRNSSFYTNTLNWSTEIWNLSQVSSGGLPIIK